MFALHRIALFTLCSGLFICSDSFAGDCIDYGNYINWIDSLYSGQIASRLESTDEYLYMTRDNHLDILDLADPDAPTVIGSVDLPNECNSIAVGGDYLYLSTDHQPSFVVVDISDPTTPTISTEVWLTGTTWDLAFFEDHLYLVNSSGHLYVFDVTDPTDPEEIADIDAFVNPTDIAVDENYVYVSSRSEGFFVLELDEFWTPTIIGFAPVWGLDLAVADGYAYMPWDYEVKVVDVTSPQSPQEVATEFLDERVYAVAAVGSRIFVSGWNLDVIDVSDPTDPVAIGKMHGFEDNTSHALVVLGDRIYVNAGGILSIFDASTVYSPDPVANLVLGNGTSYMEVRDDYAYIVDFGDGVYVIDISDPLQPFIVGYVETPNTTAEIELHGDHLYVSDLVWGIRVIDISDPTNPFIAGELNLGRRVRGFHAEGDILYATIEILGLQTYDISTPTAPAFLGRADIGNNAWDVKVTGSTAYVTDVDDGLFVVDVSDPVNPVIKGSVDVGAGQSSRLNQQGDVLYYTRGRELFALDVSNPIVPTVLSSVEASDALGRIAIGNDFVYLGAGASGLFVVNSANSAALAPVGYALPGNYASSVAVTDTHVLLTNGPGGLYVYPLQCGAAASAPVTGFSPTTRYLSAHPTPSRGAVTLNLDLAEPAVVDLEVFDTSGRRVWSAPSVFMGNGQSAVTWSGTDSRGVPLPSGIYVVRARTAERTFTTTAVLTR